MDKGREYIGAVGVNKLDKIANLLSEIKLRIDKECEINDCSKILDLGCGTGTDVFRMARDVGKLGHIIGIDNDKSKIREAELRKRNDPNKERIQFVVADAIQTEIESNFFDIVRVERLLQHLKSPMPVFLEIRRMLKDGGKLVIADTDHKSICIDSSFSDIERNFITYRADKFINGIAGRQLPRYLKEAGFWKTECKSYAIITDSFEDAKDRGLFLNGVDLDFQSSGLVSHGQWEAFVNELEERDSKGTFFMSHQTMIASGRKPDSLL